ncbi:8508_t:CDS:2, partial [Gigaspora margarita]
WAAFALAINRAICKEKENLICSTKSDPDLAENEKNKKVLIFAEYRVLDNSTEGLKAKFLNINATKFQKSE